MTQTSHRPTRRSSLSEFVWIWDRTQGLSIPKHHRKMIRFLSFLQAPDSPRNGLLMAFRNSGKSTLVGLFCAWLLTRNANTRILILSADYALAKKMVHHIKQVIEHHPLCAGLKPPTLEEWASDRFTVCRSKHLRDPSVLAHGLMGNITGCRADVIICDDVEVPKTCATTARRADLRQKLGELDYILTPGGIFLYVGTPHASDTIYNTEAGGFLADWPVLRVPLLTADGTSAWPERFSLARIQNLRRRSGATRFRSQMLLEPTAWTACRLDSARLHVYDGELNYREANGQGVLTLNGRRLVNGACWWDPAFGAPTGDRSVVACVFFDEAGNAYIHRVQYLTVPPAAEATASQCAQVAGLVAECYMPAVHLESNGIGKFLPALLRRELTRRRLPCTVLEETSSRSKTERILSAWEAPLMNGSLFIHRSIRETPLLREMQDWRPFGDRVHDDGLDAVAGALLSTPVRLGRFPNSTPQAPFLWRI